MKIINNNELRKRLNKNVAKLINKDDYVTTTTKALDLLTPNRLDIIAKYLYIKYYELNIESVFAEELYLAHIEALNGFVENDESKKVGKQSFIDNFRTLIESIKKRGFNEKHIIPLSYDLSITDGAHRVASAIFFEKKVETVILDVEKQNFNFEFFELRGLDRIYLDAMAFEYAQLKENVFMVLIWPAAEEHEVELRIILNKYGSIVYKKEVSLNMNGMIHLVKQAYRNELWVGSYQNDFEGARNKARWCFKETGILRVFLFESDQNLIEMKEEIREVFKLNKHAVHINDTKEETIELAELLFNQNSINWMNSANIIEYKKFNELFLKYTSWFAKNGIPKEDFALIGGALAIFGVRESSDIDYICKNNKEYDFVDKEIELETKKTQYLPINIHEVLYNPKYYFYARGQKFVSLEVIKSIKQARKIGNDEEDIVLINLLIQHGRYVESFSDKIRKFIRLSFWKRNIKFIVLKTRFVLFFFLKKLGI